MIGCQECIRFHHRYLDQVVDWMIEHISPISSIDPLSTYEGDGWIVRREDMADPPLLKGYLFMRYVAEIADQQMATAFKLRFC